jgi:1-aminocyclopropane-1-carboxylate deaminase/D-cysteine desulfhydrase-like pyridoxal-dependent ACC family enzyme
MSANLSPHLQFSLNSPIDSVTIQGQHFYVKRDDQLHPQFNGNKARKFLHYLLLQQPQINSVISFGGNQSNAMYALSVLAKMKQWRFDYYLKTLPEQLRTNPAGNFKSACENGMQYHEVEQFPSLHSTANRIVIPQGGSSTEAKFGIRTLADEINQWVSDKKLENCSVFLPSGTGTTAFYLQQHTTLPVFTTPCIGNAEYLQQQWQGLSSDTACYPSIIETEQPARFGQPHPKYLELWKSLLENTGIEFDLLYDPPGWLTLLEKRHLLTQHVIYIHCGGTAGNQSMFLRYNYSCKKFRQNNHLASHSVQ